MITKVRVKCKKKYAKNFGYVILDFVLQEDEALVIHAHGCEPGSSIIIEVLEGPEVDIKAEMQTAHWHITIQEPQAPNQSYAKWKALRACEQKRAEVSSKKAKSDAAA